MLDILLLIKRLLNMPAVIYLQKISGLVLALRGGSPCEMAADMLACCFVAGNPL